MMFEYQKNKALQLRHSTYDMCCLSGTGHVTSSFSCVEILVTLYYDTLRYKYDDPNWTERDYFILSKGQASPILYATLADCGFFPKEWLATFCQAGGKFGVHLQHDVPGVEFTTGSLGQGLSYAGGIAKAIKMERKNNLVFALLGDGELYEGQIWEAADFAAANRLNNLVAIVDRNGICATDFTDNFIPMDNLGKKFEAFGWRVLTCDGHSFEELTKCLKYVRTGHYSKPLCIIAHTVKGQGIESICDDPTWHACCPKNEQVDRFRQEII
jgi:transketolase